jgi:hypothetical protein
VDGPPADGLKKRPHIAWRHPPVLTARFVVNCAKVGDIFLVRTIEREALAARGDRIVIRKFRALLLLIVVACAVPRELACADFDSNSIKDAGLADIKKWLIFDNQGNGLMEQWRILAHRSERLSWWSELIGVNPFLSRKERAYWDPRINKKMYFISEKKSQNDNESHLYIIIADLPHGYTNDMMISIDFINVDYLK